MLRDGIALGYRDATETIRGAREKPRDELRECGVFWAGPLPIRSTRSVRSVRRWLRSVRMARAAARCSDVPGKVSIVRPRLDEQHEGSAHQTTSRPRHVAPVSSV